MLAGGMNAPLFFVEKTQKWWKNAQKNSSFFVSSLNQHNKLHFFCLHLLCKMQKSVSILSAVIVGGRLPF